MRILAIFVLSAGLLTSCAVYALDEASRRMLQATEDAQSSKDLDTFLGMSSSALDAKGLWRSALGMAKRLMETGGVDRTAVIRLMESALIAEGVEADYEPLSDLTLADVASMREALGFPAECDVLLYLLHRGPSVYEHAPWGEYIVTRLAPPGDEVRVIEWTSQPFLGIRPDWQTKKFSTATDPVCRNAGEFAKTQRFNLGALPDLILAAKAYRAAARADQKFVAYPFLVGAYAVNAMFEKNPTLDFRPLVYAAQSKALSEVMERADKDTELLSELTRLQVNQPRAAFLARNFGEAARGYERVEIEAHDNQIRMAAVWGRALSLFAYRSNETRAAFHRVATHIGLDSPFYSGMFGLLLRYMTDDEAKWLVDRDSWLIQVDHLLGEVWRDSDRLVNVVSDYEFMTAMLTIGRPDIAGRYLMDRLESMTDKKGQDYLLRRLAAFTRDYCYTISFELSEASGWVRRRTEGYNPLLDFLDSVNAEGGLVRGGEVVVWDGGDEPYPSLSPEEDCAIGFVVYGMRRDSMLNRLEEYTAKEVVKQQRDAVRGFEFWVREAMSRERPAPSLVPYLKLVFHDWFFQALDDLKDPELPAARFSYRPFGASELTREEVVASLRRHPAATTHIRNMIELFLATRSFLVEHYP